MKITIDGITNPSHIDNQASGKIIVDHESKVQLVVENLDEKIKIEKDELDDLCVIFKLINGQGKNVWAKIKINPLNPNQIFLFRGYTNKRGKDINEGRFACLEIIPEN